MSAVPGQPSSSDGRAPLRRRMEIPTQATRVKRARMVADTDTRCRSCGVDAANSPSVTATAAQPGPSAPPGVNRQHCLRTTFLKNPVTRDKHKLYAHL